MIRMCFNELDAATGGRAAQYVSECRATNAKPRMPGYECRATSAKQRVPGYEC